MAPPTHTEIANRAYHIWEQEGRPHGRDFDHWLAAEREVSERQPRTPARAAARTAKAKSEKRTASRTRKTRQPSA